MTNKVISGGCQCGQVRYELCVEELISYICHCTECKKQSASAFAISVPIKSNVFEQTGEMRCYQRPAHSGATTYCHFCGACGTRIFHQSSRSMDFLTLKGGTLDAPEILDPVAHLWTIRKSAWFNLPDGIEAYERQPENLSEWRNGVLEKNENS